MKKADSLTEKITRNMVKSGRGALDKPAPGRSGNNTSDNTSDNSSDIGSHDHVDAINQVFAELELAYHNQYHKAYAQEGSVNTAKKYWLECLVVFTPLVILKAVRNVVKSRQYLPSIATMVQACEEALGDYGLPTAHDAYVQACNAAHPKAEQPWPHPAVYLAGKATGWFELSNSPEAKIYPLFESHYRKLCQRALAGEILEIEIPKALPEQSSKKLSLEENKSRMSELRKSLKK